MCIMIGVVGAVEHPQVTVSGLPIIGDKEPSQYVVVKVEKKQVEYCVASPF